MDNDELLGELKGRVDNLEKRLDRLEGKLDWYMCFIVLTFGGVAASLCIQVISMAAKVKS